MTDRAAEIAREIAGGTALTVDPCDAEAIRDEHVALEQAIAAALRSYGNERLEEAAHHLARSGTTSPIQSMQPAAKLVLSLKSRE